MTTIISCQLILKKYEWCEPYQNFQENFHLNGAVVPILTQDQLPKAQMNELKLLQIQCRGLGIIICVLPQSRMPASIEFSIKLFVCLFYHHLKEQLHQNKEDPDEIPAFQHNPNTIPLRFRSCWRLICVLSRKTEIWPALHCCLDSIPTSGTLRYMISYMIS